MPHLRYFPVRRPALLLALLFVVAFVQMSRSNQYVFSGPLLRTELDSAPNDGPCKDDYVRLQARIQSFIKPWTFPAPEADKHHFPPYRDYENRDYDPNKWETFEWQLGYFREAGIERLKAAGQGKPSIYSPPLHLSPSKDSPWQDARVSCVGPRGQRLNESSKDGILAFSASPRGFPPVVIGDANVTGIDTSICFDREGRYAAYNSEQPTNKSLGPWATLRWGALQEQCIADNQLRGYQPWKRQTVQASNDRTAEGRSETKDSIAQTRDRTAILLRAWQGYNFTKNDIHALRALVTETALYSGGDYQVFLLLNVKDRGANLSDSRIHDAIVANNIPAEFRDMTILWTERMMEDLYPGVGDWQVFWHQWMPLQWFIKTHPEFEFVWNWETDARYTGHHYEFLQGVTSFSKRFPRRYMWERNQRLYVPAEHGTFDNFLADTDIAIEQGMRDGTLDPVWGPQPFDATRQTAIGPRPPTSMQDDQFEWGVGEEADLITLLPVWDPRWTKWSFRDKIWNFVEGVRPHFSFHDGVDQNFQHPAFINIPRRVFINTMCRLSRRLLLAMHTENVAGRTMSAEMWPATAALHHGLKVVYAPHPIWADRKWPSWYMDAVLNADGGQAAQWSQRPDSPYNHDREYNFMGLSWYYGAQFGRSLYRRWLGWPAWKDAALPGIGGDALEESHGRMCLPPMLLHPVKNAYAEAESAP